MKIIKISLLLTLLIIPACTKTRAAKLDAAGVAEYAVKTKTAPKEPFLGMSQSEFDKLCGERHRRLSEYQSAIGHYWTYEYDYETERADKRCYGTFTFEVTRGLVDISR